MASTTALQPMMAVTARSSMSAKKTLSSPMSENSRKNCSRRCCRQGAQTRQQPGQKAAEVSTAQTGRREGGRREAGWFYSDL